jgi:hypothetical protein
MRKLIVCVALLAAMACMTAVPSADILAQGAKKDKKDKKAGKEDSKGAVIEVTEGKDGKFRFFVRNAEGKLLAMSSPGGFATAKEAEKAVEDLKDVMRTAKVTHGKSKKEEKK